MARSYTHVRNPVYFQNGWIPDERAYEREQDFWFEWTQKGLASVLDDYGLVGTLSDPVQHEQIAQVSSDDGVITVAIGRFAGLTQSGKLWSYDPAELPAEARLKATCLARETSPAGLIVIRESGRQPGGTPLPDEPWHPPYRVPMYSAAIEKAGQVGPNADLLVLGRIRIEGATGVPDESFLPPCTSTVIHPGYRGLLDAVRQAVIQLEKALDSIEERSERTAGLSARLAQKAYSYTSALRVALSTERMMLAHPHVDSSTLSTIRRVLRVHNHALTCTNELARISALAVSTVPWKPIASLFLTGILRDDAALLREVAVALKSCGDSLSKFPEAIEERIGVEGREYEPLQRLADKLVEELDLGGMVRLSITGIQPTDITGRLLVLLIDGQRETDMGKAPQPWGDDERYTIPQALTTHWKPRPGTNDLYLDLVPRQSRSIHLFVDKQSTALRVLKESGRVRLFRQVA